MVEDIEETERLLNFVLYPKPPYQTLKPRRQVFGMETKVARLYEPAFLRQAREFLFFRLPPREASKRVPNTGERGQNFKAQTRPPGAESEPWMIAM